MLRLERPTRNMVWLPFMWGCSIESTDLLGGYGDVGLTQTVWYVCVVCGARKLGGGMLSQNNIIDKAPRTSNGRPCS